ncbi:hypothetical protein CBDKU1_01360 [Clostridium butyricum DKU-01]|nr:hypothetical protein CBDKU1_01360 [Clostridium butyricum DKU-01]KIU06523.1 hypothetical protein SC08_Contig83orf00284 [Clostridium butyricum]
MTIFSIAISYIHCNSHRKLMGLKALLVSNKFKKDLLRK